MASSAPARPRLAAIRAFARPQLVRSDVLFGSAIAAATAITGITQLGFARLLPSDEYSVVVTLFVAVTVAGVPLAYALTVQRRLPIVLAAATIVLAGALTVVWGGLQGTSRFGPLSAAQLAFAGTKLVRAVAAAALGAGADGIMGALAAASALTLVASAVPLRRYLRAVDARHRVRSLTTRYRGGAAAAVALFAALTSVDVGGTARSLLLVPTAITTVLFPRVATLADPTRERRHLFGAVATTGITGGITTGLLWAEGNRIVELAFGAGYVRAGDWIGRLAAALTVYGVGIAHRSGRANDQRRA